MSCNRERDLAAPNSGSSRIELSIERSDSTRSAPRFSRDLAGSASAELDVALAELGVANQIATARDGTMHIDLGATDQIDADDIASRAATLAGVLSAEPAEIRGRLRRWHVRQRLAGNYAVGGDGSSPGYGYADFGAGGDGGSGGGHGGHGGGGGHH